MTHCPTFFLNKGRILALWVMYTTHPKGVGRGRGVWYGPPLTLITMERFLKSLVHMHQHFRRPQVLSFSHWWWLLSWNGGLQGWRLWGSSPPNYIQGKAPALFVPTPQLPLLPLKTHLKRLNAAPGLVLCAKDTVELNSKQVFIFSIDLLCSGLTSYQSIFG